MRVPTSKLNKIKNPKDEIPGISNSVIYEIKCNDSDEKHVQTNRLIRARYDANLAHLKYNRQENQRGL